ncbi:MAG TPA: hypothetical protein VF481_07120 [Novosphingobium sp.]
MLPISTPRAGGIALALLSLLLAACIWAPGKFTSTLDIRKDGRFAFSYTGEIHMLALSKLMNDMNDDSKKTFEPSACHKDDGVEERPCTREEIATQKQEWQEERTRAAEKRRKDAESMKAILGGIDPSNPQAAEEIASRLRRQAGWKSVAYKGDGLFDVDFAIAGRLDHDFAFPTIERFPMANAFVQVTRRNDGTIRVDAPGFSPASSGEPFKGMMQGFAAKEGAPPLPQLDGRFNITTDGVVLANNTDEGPQADTAGQRLSWTINARTPAAPTALVRIAP